MGKAGELKRQFKERGIALPLGCLEVTELEDILAKVVTVDALPDDVFQQVIAAFSSRGGVPLFEEVKGLACAPRGCGSSSTGCSLSWAFGASPSCSAPLTARGASRCCTRAS